MSTSKSNGRRTHGEETPQLPDVPMGQASPEVRAVYDDIQQTLRVPFVGLFWRVLAADPPVLRLAWNAVAPNLRTRAAEDATTRLRRRALIEEAAGMSSHKAFRGDLVRAEIDADLRDKISSFNHIALYALPRHLLAVAALAEAMEGRPAGGGNGDASEVPQGLVPGAVPVPPAELGALGSAAARLLGEITEKHEFPTAPDYYRSLARLPDYLNAAWNALRPVVGDEIYLDRGRELAEMAREAVPELPYRVHFPDGQLPPGQIGEAARLLQLFRDRILPMTLMDAAIIRTLTDGPHAGPRTRFELAE